MQTHTCVSRGCVVLTDFQGSLKGVGGIVYLLICTLHITIQQVFIEHQLSAKPQLCRGFRVKSDVTLKALG